MMPPSSITPFSEGLFGSVVLPPSVEFEGFEPFEGLPPSVEFEEFEGFEVFEGLPDPPLSVESVPSVCPSPEPLPDPLSSVESVPSV